MVPTNPPRVPVTRSLKRPALPVYPTCPSSPPALSSCIATRRPGRQDARLTSRRTEMGKRAGRKLQDTTVPARLDLRAREFSRHLVLATPTVISEDVAHAVASLLDDRAGFITGQVLYVCGGMTVGLGQAA